MTLVHDNKINPIISRQRVARFLKAVSVTRLDQIKARIKRRIETHEVYVTRTTVDSTVIAKWRRLVRTITRLHQEYQHTPLHLPFPHRIQRDEKLLHQIRITMTPATDFPLAFNNLSPANLYRNSTHLDVIRSPHIDKKSREQFGSKQHKYVYRTRNIVPFMVLADRISRQSRVFRLQVTSKRKLRFQSLF